jgi:hypothetical protein
MFIYKPSLLIPSTNDPSEPAIFADRTLEPDTMQKISIGLSALLLIAATTKPGAAQDLSTARPALTAQPAIECGGQYECVEDRPLTPAEARASLGYPQVAQPQEPTRQDQARVAATPSTTTK